MSTGLSLGLRSPGPHNLMSIGASHNDRWASKGNSTTLASSYATLTGNSLPTTISRTSQGGGAKDRGEHRQAAGAFEPPSDVRIAVSRLNPGGPIYFHERVSALMPWGRGQRALQVTSAADRSCKSIFTSIAQAGDSGPQASAELSLSTLDARTLLLKVGTALFAKPANLSELSKRH